METQRPARAGGQDAARHADERPSHADRPRTRSARRARPVDDRFPNRPPILRLPRRTGLARPVRRQTHRRARRQLRAQPQGTGRTDMALEVRRETRHGVLQLRTKRQLRGDRPRTLRARDVQALQGYARFARLHRRHRRAQRCFAARFDRHRQLQGKIGRVVRGIARTLSCGPHRLLHALDMQGFRR